MKMLKGGGGYKNFQTPEREALKKIGGGGYFKPKRKGRGLLKN